MIMKIVKIIKQFIVAFILLYSFNLIMSGYNFYIPINIFTLFITAFLGFPGLFMILGTLILI